MILTASVLTAVVLLQLACTKEYSCENCQPKNKPPIANAGTDSLIILPVDSIMLDGSHSIDPDGVITSFLWKKISGPSFLTINNSTNPKTIVKGLVKGTYQFELKVIDNGGLFAMDTVIVKVDSIHAINHPPVANAGQDIAYIHCDPNYWQNFSFGLDGNGSTDPDNNIVNYMWTRLSGPPLPACFPVNVPGSPTQVWVINLVPGIVVFELTVTDVGGLSSKDTVQVSLIDNQSPVANIAPVTSINLPTNSVVLNGSGSTDPENNISTYEWTKSSGPVSFNIISPKSAQTQVTNLTAGTYYFQLKVTDICGLFSTGFVQVIVNP